MRQIDVLLIVLGEAIRQLGGRLKVNDEIMLVERAPQIVSKEDVEAACQYFSVKVEE